MPEIVFCKNNRILGCRIRGHQSPRYMEIQQELEEPYNTINVDSPFEIQEIWYVAGLKNPKLIAIDSDHDYYDQPVAQWKIYYNQQYAERKAGNYVMTSNSKRFNP